MGNEEKVKARVRRVRSRGHYIAIAVCVVVLAGLAFWLLWFGFDSGKPLLEADAKNTPGGRDAGNPPVPHAFEGTSFESSGVVFVPGTNGVLFVDDGRSSGCFWMQLDDSGQQLGPVKYVHIDASIEDPESITTDGTYFYIMGSQSEPAAGSRNAFARFKFDPNTATVSNVEIIGDLRGFLLKSVPELSSGGEKSGADGGLNVEGITWSPDGKAMLLGLRSPMIEGQTHQALIIAIRLKNPDGPFSLTNIELASPQAVRLRMGNLSVRDLHYDSRLKSFLIIAGAPKDREKGSFSLWQWDGSPDGTGVREVGELDSRLKPEGITRVEVGGDDYLFIVYDSSSYSRLDYSSLTEK
jgi:hypothetical protein